MLLPQRRSWKKSTSFQCSQVRDPDVDERIHQVLLSANAIVTKKRTPKGLLQHSSPTLLYKSLQHSSPTIVSNTLLQHSSTTQLSTLLQNPLQHYSTRPRVQHFSTKFLGRRMLVQWWLSPGHCALSWVLSIWRASLELLRWWVRSCMVLSICRLDVPTFIYMTTSSAAPLLMNSSSICSNRTVAWQAYTSLRLLLLKSFRTMLPTFTK